MRIVFIGAVEFSRRCLVQVIRCGGNVVAVFGLDGVKSARHGDYADMGPLAGQHGLPFQRITNINSPTVIEAVRQARPDVVFVFGWSQLIGPDIRGVAPCVGSHPAMLPLNRGRHPVIWALVEGLAESGLTFFYLDEGADSGDILWQRPFAISEEDDAGSLLEKISQLAELAIYEFMPQLSDGSALRRPQDHRITSYWRKRTAADGEIDWRDDARKVHNLVRALTHPYPGATARIAGEQMIIWKTCLTSHTGQGEPGEVLARTPLGWNVATGAGTIEIVSASGPDLSAGLRFESRRDLPVPSSREIK